ncbi:hypothetical protein XELAEV_18032163mg [Xenopus laevis]|uniref:SGNH hydrolase-type esterase domain-containing protein n=1 Tax=Xenopus laevis TaxID=8355 RepID=A0A974CP22_XENLA|nr:hypothetical protein XELAEV_18032163mg [Xenopus laevis]
MDFTKTYIVKQILKGLTRKNKSVDTRKPITIELLNELINVLPEVAVNAYECILFRALFILAFFAALRRVCSHQAKSHRSIFLHQDGKFVSRYQFASMQKMCLLKLAIPTEGFKTHSFRIGAALQAALLGFNENTIKTIGRWESARYKLAGSRSYGVNLSLDCQKYKILWMGIRGLRWNDLISVLLQMLVRWGYPDVVHIHLGGNDIGKDRTVDLINQMKRDLSQIRAMMEDVISIWSEIVPRLVWFSPEKKLLEKCRRKVNHCVSKFAKTLNIIVFRHFDLEPIEIDLTEFTCQTYDISNNGLQTALEKALFIGGVSTAVRGL